MPTTTDREPNQQATFWLPVSMIEQLRQLAREEDRPISSIVRNAIRRALAERKDGNNV